MSIDTQRLDDHRIRANLLEHKRARQEAVAMSPIQVASMADTLGRMLRLADQGADDHGMIAFTEEKILNHFRATFGFDLREGAGAIEKAEDEVDARARGG